MNTHVIPIAVVDAAEGRMRKLKPLTDLEARELQAPRIAFELDGREVIARAGETIIQVADREGVEIPRLCFKDGLEPAGNCRACVVEIAGERVLAASCCRAPAAGMKVTTDSKRARRSQKLVLELLQSDMPREPRTRHSELARWARALDVGAPRFPAREAPAPDLSHPAIAVNLDACIQCTRCVRACRDSQMNDVIGLAHRGAHAKIVFDMDDAMGASTCVACGECVQACPTGALMPARDVALQVPDRQVDSVCPYCGVGCQLTYNVKDNRILYVEGRDGPANHGRLCVKGRYGFDYAHHPHRLTRPLIRRADAPGKRGDFTMDPERVMDVFREATWEEALAFAGGTLKAIRDRHGPKALAGFGSAKGSNEEAYLFQKLVRTGFGSNNVDHCTRLCHASSVAALLEGIGSGAVSNPVMDVTRADVVILIGANPTVNHPVAATWMKNAVRSGTKLVVCDPRRSDLSRIAHCHLQFKPDTDVALLNAMMNVIVTEGLVDQGFIESRTIGYDELRRNVAAYTPEAMAPVCGIDAEVIREVARLYATSGASMILWGMGVSQHVHGTDNARCLIALSLMTGQIGRPGTGLHPLRGQNNVQGASDAGLIPMMFPDYQHVSDPADARALRARMAAAGRHAGGRAGTHGRGSDAGDRGRQRARHVHHGREPRHVRPRRQPRARGAGRAGAPGGAGHLPHRDRLPRRRDPAGQRLPREDRHLHQHRPPRAAGPPGAGAARRCAPGPVDHPADRAAARPGLARCAGLGGVRRDAPHHAEHRRHHVGASAARACGDLPVPP
jgi:formate dehydrogenase major subunit